MNSSEQIHYLVALAQNEKQSATDKKQYRSFILGMLETAQILNDTHFSGELANALNEQQLLYLHQEKPTKTQRPTAFIPTVC